MSTALNKLESLIDQIESSMAEQKSSNDDDKLEIIDIIDTHIHLWNVDTSKREWLSSPGLEDINKTYDINKYYSMYNNQTGKPNNTFINLKYGIFMETDVDDKDIMTEINEITTICKNPNNNLKGMIIKMDPNVSSKQFLQTFNKLKNNGYIVGIRKVLINHGFPNNEIPQLFIDNVKNMNNYWPFDIVINIELLQSVEKLIKSLPDQIFILDHMGNHHQICDNDKLYKIWQEQIKNLSKYNNLCIKLSGMTGGQPGLKLKKKWSFQDETKHIDIILDNFDQDRIVYGCDWPVSVVPLHKDNRDNFLQLWTMNLYKYLKQKKGKAFCDKVFVKNAVKIYKLKV